MRTRETAARFAAPVQRLQMSRAPIAFVRLATAILVSVMHASAVAQTGGQSAQAQIQGQTSTAQTGGSTALTGQRFKLATPTLVLGPGQQSGTFTVAVLASGLPTDTSADAQPALVDQRSPAAPAVEVVTSLKSSPGDPKSPTRLWQFAVDVKLFPPAASQSRTFLLSYGNLHETLPYTLTNIEARSFTWSVKASPEWNLGSMTRLAIPIRVGDVPVTAVTLHQADFSSDDKLKRTLGKEHFSLCSNASGEACQAPGALTALTPHDLFLKPNRQIPPGVFKGNVSLLAREKADPEVLAVTIYSPRPGGLWWGLAALTVGVLLSLVTQVVTRSWYQRKREREVIVLLRKRVEDLGEQFKTLPANLQTGAAAWANRRAQLLRDLDGMMPLLRPLIPPPFEVEVSTLETFKAELEKHGATFTFLKMLLTEGLEKVANIQQGDPTRMTAANTAADTIANIAPSDQAMSQVAAALNALRAAVGQPQPLRAPARASADEELKRIGLQLVAAGIAVWLFWAVTSILSGAALLILQNPAFGTEMDLLVCVLWGLGITVAGQQASQVTPAGVAGTIGVKFPGSKP